LGYRLEAVVARKPVAAVFGTHLRSAYVVDLEKGYALVPLTEGVIRELSPGQPWDRGQLVGQSEPQLPHGLCAALAELSTHGPVAYLEAAFFGGEGLQAAVVWNDGVTVLGPIIEQAGERRWLHEGAINQALREIGVTAERPYRYRPPKHTIVHALIWRLGIPPTPVGKDEFATLGLGRARRTEEWPALAEADRAAI
jgi:hypothetical protein